jgi:glycosyltransferase involved in cell wall biosynthesis
MTKPFFSVIIPALNEERYLPHLLHDLSAQSYRDFEVIVVDGKSEDNTVEEVKKFARTLPHLTILTSERRNVSLQRNLGAKNAKGEYIVFMDADNRLEGYFLSGLHYRTLSEQPDAFTTYLSIQSPKPSLTRIADLINIYADMQLYTNSPFFMEALIGIKTSVFQKVGGFNPKVLISEGTPFVQKLKSNNFSIKIFHDPTYYYSLRRIERYGIINLAGKVAQVEFIRIFQLKPKARTLKKLYPMLGGSLFNTSKNAQKKLVGVENLIQTITTLNTESLPKIKKELRKFLS